MHVQSAYEDAARKNALAKLISQLSGGKTVEFYQSKVAEAEAMARKSAAESFEAAAKDR